MLKTPKIFKILVCDQELMLNQSSMHSMVLLSEVLCLPLVMGWTDSDQMPHRISCLIKEYIVTHPQIFNISE